MQNLLARRLPGATIAWSRSRAGRTARHALALAAGLAAVASPALAAEDRAYEMVTPPEKGGIPLDLHSTFQAAESGDAVAYPALGAFGGALTSLVGTYYIGRRSESGWSVEPVDAPQLVQEQAPVARTTRFFSSSLHIAMQFSNAALLPGAIDGGGNLYRLSTESMDRELVAASPQPEMGNVHTPLNSLLPPLAGDADLSHFAFPSKVKLLPDAPANRTNVYEFANGALRLVNHLPNGSVSANGGLLPAQRTVLQHVSGTTSMSEDGRRVFFQAPATSSASRGPLYVRVDGVETLPISTSHRPQDDPTLVRPADFVGASDDGKIVYFISEFELTTDADGDAFANLYRLDTTTDELTLVNALLDPDEPLVTDITRVYGGAPDGSSLYFMTRNLLTPDAPAGGGYKIYRYEHDQGLELVVGDLAEGASASIRVSDNGRYLIVADYSQATGFDNFDPACVPEPAYPVLDGTCAEIFRFDSVTGDLECVSCLHDHGGNGHSFFEFGPARTISEHKARSVTDDGEVFFTSRESLSPSDINGKLDVYSWTDDGARLISSGRDSRDSHFVEASPDGRDVFFATYEQLVARDTDAELDLYDARVGGGIAAQHELPTPPGTCDGDSCQGGLEGGPVASGIGSLGLAGAGDASRRPAFRATVSLVRRSVHGASFRLRVKTPTSGRVVTSGPGLRRAVRQASRATTYVMRVELTRKARHVLTHKGRLRVRARVVFEPLSGRRSASSLTVVLRSANANVRGGA